MVKAPFKLTPQEKGIVVTALIQFAQRERSQMALDSVSAARIERTAELSEKLGLTLINTPCNVLVEPLPYPKNEA